MESPFSSSSPLSMPASFGRPPRPAATLAGVMGLWPVLPAALLIGVVYHFIGQFLDLLILFPLLAGGCVGGVIAARAKKHKVRSKPLLVTLALVAGLTCFAARWMSDAIHTREHLIAERTAKLSASNPTAAPRIESILRRVYSPARFLGLYVRVLDKEGTTIGDVGSFSSASHNSAITGTGFWMLTLFDALLMCGAAVAVGASQASQPFCTGCDSWYGPQLTVSRLHPNQATDAARLAGEGKLADLGGLRNEGATQKSYCDVLLSKCPGCATGQLSVKRALNNQIKTLWKGAVSPPQVKQLEEVRAQWLQ